MKACEHVELSGGRNDDLMQRFAAAIRGDYKQAWDDSTQEQKTNWIAKFSDDVEAHAKRAFDVGVQYGLEKAKQIS
tara:strand:- start:7749 stop:7976 length:228 start_codon:yes stop_codon:yes gene_type:complete